MVNPGSYQVYTTEAPYVSRTSSLIKSPRSAPHRFFYRLTAQQSQAPTEIFSVGHFESIELSWQSINSAPDPWGLLNQEIRKLSCTSTALVGTMDYETGYAFENNWQNLPVPTSGYAFQFCKVPCWYQVNHHKKTAAIHHVDDCNPEFIRFLKHTIDSVAQYQRHSHVVTSANSVNQLLNGELTEQQYCERVDLILSDILAGRFYELNFTQRFQQNSPVAPNQLFATIDDHLKPAKAFYSESESNAICSFSPELYLQKTGDTVVTRPIKGSYQGILSGDSLTKLEAEHIMVVDLARNDLGRISNLAPVVCPEVLSRKNLGSLHHLESQINAYTSFNWIDVLSNTYPAASITGAPKVEVVQAISQYEGSRRGLYTGTCGWIWPNGDVDLNVAIRTLVGTRLSDMEWRYTMGAGGAIVADSTPAGEYRECLQKIDPFLRALESRE